MLCGESERRGSEEDGTDAGQENIGTVEVRRETEFATQMAKPQDHRLRPCVSDVVHKQGSKQDEHEDPPHALQGLHPHVLDIQAIFLVEAVGVFDLGSVSPFSVYGSGVSGGVNGHIGEQDYVVT